ncbi:hypothetical protein HC031_14105 [Planosporangium thailandense]|uniref:Uncharacterized protein n=1 Tax=Planosporangium thailandense TaxID=765197 RepID=A0ABX0XYB5_9ACTN|nr:hypothetical protein [Planosporangium thailandense]NJC70841.1 hypothetical protein [Planosporangium thailandense]
MAIAISAADCGAMMAALIRQCRATQAPRPAGALAALSWLTGVSDRRPVSRDVQPATAGTVGVEMDLADRIARGLVASAIPAAYAAGTVDAVLWALGRRPRQPLT